MIKKIVCMIDSTISYSAAGFSSAGVSPVAASPEGA
jgi:hypothetical protein